MAVADVLSAVRLERRLALNEVEAKEVVRQAGVPAVETALARTREEAVASARSMGFPVALKIVSPDILHKSDAGGVKLDLGSVDQVAAAWDAVLAAAKGAHPAASILGVAVQRMAPPGVEVIIGGSKDPQFGPVLMFGLGGVFVEVLKDVAFRLVPLTLRDAQQMVREIRGYPVLEGYRGQPPADIAALEEALLSVSRLLEEHPEIKELDLNPVFAYQQGILAVDARIILEEPPA